MKTKIFKNGTQMMVMLLAFLILLTMQKLVAQVCTSPSNTIYGLTGTGDIHPITVSTGVVGAKINPVNTGTIPDLSNAMGYNQLNGKFYYFKRNVKNAPQEFVSWDPVFNTVTILANSPVNTVVNLGCITADGTGYYCIDALGYLFYYSIATNTWTTVSTNVRNTSGTTLGFIISAGSVPTTTSKIYGDIAIDGFGNMWILISGPTQFGLYKLSAPLPTTPTATVTINQVMAPTTPTPESNSIGGVAFNTTGQMLMSTNSGHNKLYRINNNYSVTTIASMDLDGIGTDLTSCSYPMYVLSITWNEFTAAVKNDNTVLNWTVGEKKDNTGFEIEHSADSIKWEVAGYVRGNGKESTSEDYSFTHKGVVKGRHHYRIVSIDRTGKKLYSETRVVNMISGATISLWPNPAQDIIKVEASTDNNNANGKISVYDQVGRQVKTLIFQNGLNTIEIKSLTPGNYFVRIDFADGQTVNQRFIKRAL